MINERKNSEDSILSCNGIEILIQKSSSDFIVLKFQ